MTRATSAGKACCAECSHHPTHEKRMKCSQVTCMAPAGHLFTWPGSPEQASCYRHALWAQQIARAMGLELGIRHAPDVCPIAEQQTGGAFYCSREPSHDGPCAAVPVAGVAVCDQEGGTVSIGTGLAPVPVRCTYLPGHEGRHSWEPFE